MPPVCYVVTAMPETLVVIEPQALAVQQHGPCKCCNLSGWISNCGSPSGAHTRNSPASSVVMACSSFWPLATRARSSAEETRTASHGQGTGVGRRNWSWSSETSRSTWKETSCPERYLQSTDDPVKSLCHRGHVLPSRSPFLS